MAFPVWKVTIQRDGQPVETRWHTDYYLISNDFSYCMDNGGAFSLAVEEVQAEELSE